jgi:hypothetical protein
VTNLIIPGIILLLLGLWGAFETGRKFRNEFRRRGKAWEAVCAALDRDEGVLVVDTIWGPQRGFGHPTLWWIPAVVNGEPLAPKIETPDGGARLTRCPRSLRNLDALRQRFGSDKVRVHTWDVGAALTAAGQEVS